MFEIDIFFSIDEIDEGVWRRLNGERPFSSAGWFRFLERAFGDDRPIYIMLSRSAVPVARAVFWVKGDEPLPLAPSPLRAGMAAVLRRRPLLLGYDPLVGGQSSLLLPEEPGLRSEALAAIVEMAQVQLNIHNGSFLLYSYLNERQKRQRGWPADFLTMDFDEPETALALEWDCFEGYLAWLRRERKSAYKDYKRHRNKAARAGIEVTVHDSVTAVEEALALVRATERKHGSMPHPNARAVMEEMGMVGGRWLAARRDGSLVGCGLLLGDNGGWAMKFLGLDYNVRYAYFQLIYTALQEVIEAGGCRLMGGTGAYELKERLGFQRQPNTHVGFMSGSPALRWLGGKLARRAV